MIKLINFDVVTKFHLYFGRTIKFHLFTKFQINGYFILKKKKNKSMDICLYYYYYFIYRKWTNEISKRTCLIPSRVLCCLSAFLFYFFILNLGVLSSRCK